MKYRIGHPEKEKLLSPGFPSKTKLVLRCAINSLTYDRVVYLYSYSLPVFSNNLLAFCLSAEGNLFTFYASWSQNEYQCLTMIP